MTHIVTPLSNNDDVIRQALRFIFSGGLLTLAVAASYWILAGPMRVNPMVSLLSVFIIFTLVGYVVHSRFSFRGHGSRGTNALRTIRFFVVSIAALCINQLFVWFLTDYLNGPVWWPILPIVFVTPVFTFFSNRRWVYGPR